LDFKILLLPSGNLHRKEATMDHQAQDSAGSENSAVTANKKEPVGNPPNLDFIEAVRTLSKVPGNDNYYEKGGLRTYGDNEDHDHEPPVSSIDR